MILNISNAFLTYDGAKRVFETGPFTPIAWNIDKADPDKQSQTITINLKSKDIGGQLAKHLKDNTLQVIVKIVPSFYTNNGAVLIDLKGIGLGIVNNGKRKPAIKKLMRFIGKIKMVGYSLEAIAVNKKD